MFKQVMTFLVFLGVLSLSAEASVPGLKTAMDELNYALMVEWDQQDPEFFEREVERFSGAVEVLRAGGMSNGEMVNVIKSQLKDKKSAADFEEAMILATAHRPSGEEISDFLLKRSYSRGASFHGEVVMNLLFSIPLLVAVIVITQISMNDVNCEKAWSCTNDCSSPWQTGTVCRPVCSYRCI